MCSFNYAQEKQETHIVEVIHEVHM